MRLLIILFAGYLGYRYLKSRIISHTASSRQFQGRGDTGIDDVMVKDPYCEAYFPKRNGVSMTLEGREFYFCSKECRDKFSASRNKKTVGGR
jgi:YHS domain-containing protein